MIKLRHERLPTRPHSRSQVFFHRVFGRPVVGFAGARGGAFARCFCSDPEGAAVLVRCVCCVAGSPARDLDLAAGGCGLFDTVGCDQGTVYARGEGVGSGGVEPHLTNGFENCEGGCRDLAAPVLGAHHSGRTGLPQSYGVLLGQSDQTWVGRAPGRLAVFVDTPRYSCRSGRSGVERCGPRWHVRRAVGWGFTPSFERLEFGSGLVRGNRSCGCSGGVVE